MTNSIASAKCPSVLTSGNYGMTQNRCTDNSKEYFFVKLTDSAYRALEEYQRNENSKRFPNGQRAKIQVNGNTGVIYFPTLEHNETRKFGFTIDDVEGSLECIQQTPQGLDVLGSMSYRMRIHANDDIYDTTRTKMAIAEETEKSKCIREIKPNQTDIGRKVKKLVSSFHHHTGNSGNNSSNINSSSSYLSNSISRNKSGSLNNSSPPNGSSMNASSSKLGATSTSSRSPNPSLLGGSGTVNTGTGSSSGGGSGSGGGNNNNRYGNHSSANLYSQNSVSQSLPSLTSASSLSSTLAGGIANGYAAAVHNSPTESSISAASGGGGGSGGSMGSGKSRLGNGNSNFGGGSVGARGNSFSASKTGGNSKSSGNGSNPNGSGGGSKLPDISRRKIRERLIHLLALRPFKKPELYARLHNEGLRDRERSLISNVLKDIATLSRDNTYNLRRQMWNDVNENWPYYTEQELQQLKRRKPQNLTPPLSSDAGSSTSGQSPTSTHTGSPPPLVGGSGSGSGNGLKRTSLECDRNDEAFMSRTQPKKQRISHFKKDAITASSTLMGAGSGSSTIRPGYGSNNRNKSSITYSPQGCHNTQADENSGNSDLSFNVLSNVDDIISNMEQSNGFGNSGSLTTTYNSGARKLNGNGNSNNSSNKLSVNHKENRHSSGNNSSMSVSPKNSYSSQELESSSKLMMRKTSNSSVSPAPYTVNFVPESSKSSSGNNRNGNGNGSSTSSNSNHRHQSPNLLQQQQQQHHHKHNSSVKYSPKKLMQTDSPRDESNSTTGRNSSSKGQSSGRSSVSKTVRTPTPPMQEYTQQQQHQQHYLHQRHYQQPQTQTHSSHLQPPMLASGSELGHGQGQGQAQYHAPVQEQPAISPTMQQLTSVAPEAQCYDFSDYTRITSIEQRRQYKTEFERDYGEYHQLRERIEDVRRNFELLADQLHRAPQGCSDYEAIKQQIVAEYERINNEEEPKRDKQRFDYLHAKLAHIKQLVTDYDKTLTSMAAAAAAQQHQQQQLQQNQQQQQYTAMHHTDSNLVEINVLSGATRTARVSPMVSSESNHSPPTYHQQSQQQQLSQSQPQLSAHFDHHQYHDAETIQKKQYYSAMEQYTPPQDHASPSTNINDINSSAAQFSQQQQHPHQVYNSHNAMHIAGSDHTHSERQHQQNRQLHDNNNDNGNDSDSDDSSDSNSNDDDDEDDSNDDDDEDDSNSNDDEDDDDDNSGH